MKQKIFNNLEIDNIYCLYLEKNKERKNNVLKEFEKANLQVEMFEGINHENSATGCLLGHVNIVKDAKKNGYKNILIFEDDIEIKAKFPININVPKFDMFYFGYWDFDNCSVPIDNIYDNNNDINYNLMRLFYCRSTYAYIINEKLFDSVIGRENYNPVNNLFNIIDMFYCTYIQPRKQYSAYGLYPFIVTTKDRCMPAIEEKAKFSLENNKKDSKNFMNKIKSGEEFFHPRKKANPDTGYWPPDRYNW
jgi:GR25 family glycosyltransferase involved in LPS biosynthesis